MTIDNNTAWVKKHQPDKIDGFVFSNNQHRELINSWIENERLDGNVILYGPPGTGKTTLIEILIRKIIKAQPDLFRMRTRSVKEIDELREWVQRQPTRSPHNIVYIEEIDRLSREAMATLKDGLMEKHIKTCVFLCATNHPRRINPALFSRFTYKFNLDSFDPPNLAAKIKDILDKEKAIYNEDQLKDFVSQNYQQGLRDILNNLQISYITNNKNIIFSSISNQTELEESVVSLILNIIKTMLELTDARQRKQCVIYPINSVVSNDYTNLVTILNNNWDIDYQFIFEELINRIKIYPCQNICVKYAESLENKKYSHFHLISCLYEIMESCSRMIL